MTSEEDLKARIGELETELDNKEHEIIAHLDKIEQLEDQLMKLEELDTDDDKGKKGKKGKESKLSIELEDKDREIRDLKDKLGYLRKEKIQLQQELEKAAKSSSQGSVIRIEEKKSPLDQLVGELQTKINKQRLLITKLKQQAISADSAELNEKLREKEEESESLKEKVSELEKRVTQAVDSRGSDTITKALTEELQTKLNKAKREIDALKQKLGKKGKKAEAEDTSAATNELQEKVDELKEDITHKEKKISELKTQLESAKAVAPPAGGVAASALTEELQTKLNKAKIQINTLQEQLKEYQAGKVPASGASQADIEGELQMQKELVISLQQEIEDHKQKLQSKDGEVLAAKNEAVQSQLKCEDLENAVKLKEQKIEELKRQITTIQSQSTTVAPAENPHIALRVRELKSMIEDLNKQNIQQRIEISQLRKT